MKTDNKTNTPFSGEAQWIWSKGHFLPLDSVGETVCLRRVFELDRDNANLIVHVSADAEYILYCNGRLVGRGPARGDVRHQFYDTYDLTGSLRPGKNCICALAIGFSKTWSSYLTGGPPANRMTATNAFILDGLLKGDNVADFALHTDERWKARFADEIQFVAVASVPLAGPGEKRQVSVENIAWLQSDFDDSNWSSAAVLAPGVRPDNVWNSPLPYRLVPRQIPFLLEEVRSFVRVFDAGAGSEHILSPGQFMEINPHSKIEFTLDAGVMTTGYPRIILEGGACNLTLFYAEQLNFQGQRLRNPDLPHEPVTGPLHDIVEHKGGPLEWQPCFWRAFRFIRLKVDAGALPVRLKINGYIFTAYPYQLRGSFSSNDECLNQMWAIGARTLQLCSHETFEDCPYYERLQYGGDIQVSARVAYAVSGDTRLAAQAIRQFGWSINDEGITAGSYPSRVPQILPLWSLHWIATIYDYYMFTGETTIIQENIRSILAVLDWFRRRKKGKLGLLGHIPYWCVADWSPEWEWRGVPPGTDQGKGALPNLFLISCLRQAAVLAGAIGRMDEAKCLCQEALLLADACNAAFWDESIGLFRDVPGADGPVSQLTNAWAILSEAATAAQANKITASILDHPKICRASLFGKYFIFEALLRAGSKQKAHALLGDWGKIIGQGFTTWPEGTTGPRSECHAWSALPNVALHELALGVTKISAGCGKIKIDPYWNAGSHAAGTIPLPQGDVVIKWRRDGKEYDFAVLLPENVEAEIRLPDAVQRLAYSGAEHPEWRHYQGKLSP